MICELGDTETQISIALGGGGLDSIELLVVDISESERLRFRAILRNLLVNEVFKTRTKRQ